MTRFKVIFLSLWKTKIYLGRLFIERPKGRYVFSWGGGGGGGGGRGGLGVISESEHQKGRAILICELFKVRVTHLFQNFLMRIFKEAHVFSLPRYCMFKTFIKILKVYTSIFKLQL